MSFDCHGQPIALPADLGTVFIQPKSIHDFHFVLQRVDPALKEIFTLVSHSQYGHYLRRYAADFVIQDFIIFISRKAPSGKAYWECYVDGPRKYPFAHWVCCCFMAYLKRPETKAQLQRRRQAIDTREAAGRKPAQAFINDPKGYWTPPTTAPTSSGPEQTPRATEAIRIEANAQSTQPARNSGQPGNDIIVLRADDEDDANEACPTIQFIKDDTNDEA
jgi:hypothetical protein